MNNKKNIAPQKSQLTLSPLEDTPLDIPDDIEKQYQLLLNQLQSYHTYADINQIRHAFEYAYAKHKTQKRKSGEPYIIHPLGVALLVAQLKLDEASICTALLHDVVEDTNTPISEIESTFSTEIAELVDGLTKLSKYQFTSTIERQAANFRKMLLAMSKDLRVILIKLADRVHNMRTLDHMKPEKQKVIAQETIDIYVPIANRLGIDWIKTELENLSLKFLHPEEYIDLEKKVQNLQEERKQYISEIIEILHKALQMEGFKNFQIKGRFKHIYSIYRKLKRSNTSFEKLHDIIAFRILVNTKAECYHALGIIHSMWTLVSGNKFKDYISLPKPNQYRSLHTSVNGPQNVQFEVQIRTYEMDEIAEEGIAAHWKYKEPNYAPAIAEQRNYEWLRQLMEWQQELEDPSEFLNTIKLDLFADEVYVFTPTGELINLPRGSTPIDFAYAIHSEVGNTCAGATVNGEIVPLKYQLETGNRVDIITKPNQKPKSDWLQMVSSTRAKNRISRFLKLEERKTQKQVGAQVLEKGLRKAKISPNAIEKLPDPSKLYAALKLSTHEQLLLALGSEKIKIDQLVEKLKPLLPQNLTSETQTQAPISQEEKVEKIVDRHNKRSQTNICVEGINNLAIHFAKCCSPVPGEPIVGFVTRGRGLAIHHLTCQRIMNLEPERLVECHWDPQISVTNDITRSVNLKIVAADKIGMLLELTQIMSQQKINITQSHCRTSNDSQAIFAFEVQIRNISQLTQLLKTLAKIPGVYSAERVTS